MNEEIKIYTGTISYRDVTFMFTLNEGELVLNPASKEDYKKLKLWGFKQLGEGLFYDGDPITIDEVLLGGYCFETSEEIAFLTYGDVERIKNSAITIRVRGFILFRDNTSKIGRIAFKCKEFNFIHPNKKAVQLNIQPEESNKEERWQVTTRDCNVTTTPKQRFSVDGVDVFVFFGISRSYSVNISDPVLNLDSILFFEFEGTDDYMFLYKLWGIAREFTRFLCYKKNIYFRDIMLCSLNDDKKYYRSAQMFIEEQQEIEDDSALIKGRYIKQELIEGIEGKILRDIADNKIYTRHFPDSYKKSKKYDAARFVMITAAFEWEFSRNNPEGVIKSENTQEAEKVVSEALHELISQSTGKQREIYKYLYKQVKNDSLENKVTQTLGELKQIIWNFGDDLYRQNDQILVLTDVGKRLSDQRNHFAHGDLDEEFIGLSFLDLLFLEMIVYAMQLVHYEIDEEKIRTAINDLFERRLSF